MVTVVVGALLVAGCGVDATSTGSVTTPAVASTPATASAAPTNATPAGVMPKTDASFPANSALPSTTPAASTVVFGALADMAIASTDGHVAISHGGTFGPAWTGKIAADQHTVVTTSWSAGSTTLTWTSVLTGSQIARTSLGGELTAVATDLTAQYVALTTANPAAPGGTEIVIADTKGEAFRHAYTSELLPEGFSNITTETGMPMGLFVIEYLDPPGTDTTAPRRYRVRVVDTTTGELNLPFDLRDKGQTVDEAMLGFSRTHVVSPANGLLFTLYRGLDSDEKNYAFVHTLGFVNGVYCLDLPPELWLERLPGAVVLTHDESRLLVASANGYVTEVVVDDITDPSRTPAPSRTEQVWSAPPNAAGPALASAGTRVLVGQDDTLRWVDADTLAITATQQWDMHIDAVALMPGGDAVAAGTGRVSEITPDGQLAAELPLPDGFGTAAQIVVQGGKGTFPP